MPRSFPVGDATAAGAAFVTARLAAALFPNSRGLLVTANTERADGKGLGRHADGLADTLVEGPGMRDLINQGYLSDYRIFAPPSDLNLDGVEIGSTGDFKQNQLKLRIKKSHVVGDVVEHYKRLANGKQGITFATDVETATEIAAQFNAAGVPAEAVSAKTPDRLRVEISRRFERGEIKQLVNVDLFGEGYDVPAVEVVSMARPTESFNLFCQQFGRSLRILEGKTGAIIIDHVGNVMRHGLPDAYQAWTLDRREKGKRKKKEQAAADDTKGIDDGLGIGINLMSNEVIDEADEDDPGTSWRYPGNDGYWWIETYNLETGNTVRKRTNKRVE